MTNLTTYIILVLTFPIWFWFKDKWKAKWLEKQKIKFSKPLNLKYSKPKWFRAGLIFGVLMFVFSVILLPLIHGEDLTAKKFLIGIPLWALAGFLFGYAMKRINRKKMKN